MINKSIKNRGFTLLEMLVSLGIFAIVAVIAVGSLVRITGLNRQAQALQASMNNIAFALESISRDMRVGTNYDCDFYLGSPRTACNVGAIEPASGINMAMISFDSSKSYVGGGSSCQLIYYYVFRRIGMANKWSLRKAEQSSCDDSGPTEYSILDETNMTIDGFQIGVYKDSGYDRAFIRLKGFAGTKETEKNRFDIQTSISSRISN